MGEHEMLPTGGASQDPAGTARGPSKGDGPQGPGEDISHRLNQVATTLIGGTAALTGLFALLGANSDRIWVALDNPTTKNLLWVTIVLAGLAIALGLRALLTTDSRVVVLLLTAGSAAFVASLGLAVFTASEGANQFARPSFTKVMVERSSPDLTTVSFTVHADSVDRSQRIAVRIVDVATGQPLYEASLPSDVTGVAEQNVSLRTRVIGALRLEAWHRDGSHRGSEVNAECQGPKVAAGTACVAVGL